MKIKITKNYSQKQLFDNFELELQKEEIVCVLGCSGVGKTTLLNAFAGLLEFEGELLEVPKQVAFVFQTPRLLPHLTVTENLRYAFEDRVSDEKIERMLEKCRLTECKNRKARLLSGGGEKARSVSKSFFVRVGIAFDGRTLLFVGYGVKACLDRAFCRALEGTQKDGFVCDARFRRSADGSQ